MRWLAWRGTGSSSAPQPRWAGSQPWPTYLVNRFTARGRTSKGCSGGLIVEIVPRPSMLADIQGIAMWWFSKGKRKRKEIWDENIQWPIGDIEAAHRIRDICRSAADSAEKVGGFANHPDKKNNRETARF